MVKHAPNPPPLCCAKCGHYRVGRGADFGYVTCTRSEMDVDTCTPAWMDECSRTRQNGDTEFLIVWVRRDAARKVDCFWHTASTIVIMQDRKSSTSELAKYRKYRRKKRAEQRDVDALRVMVPCPFCGTAMPDGNRCCGPRCARKAARLGGGQATPPPPGLGPSEGGWIDRVPRGARRKSSTDGGIG